MTDPLHAPAPSARAAFTWRRYLRFWGPRAEADVDDELRFHIDMRIRDFMARGMTEDDARAATLRRLGDLAQARDACVNITTRRERRMTRAQLFDAFTQDIRFALRTLGRQKGWTAVAILTLALGIGANTAVFSVVNSLLLHPLRYPGADRLAVVFLEPSEGNKTGIRVMISVDAPLMEAWKTSSHSFSELEAYSTTDMTLESRESGSAILQTAMVLPSFPRFAGEYPLIGRGFSETDITDGGRVVMLGESLWRGRYGSDPNILGKAISLDGQPYTVVGVMPASLRLPRLLQESTDLWLPLDLRNKNVGLGVIGRLRPGVTFGAATKELDSIQTRARLGGNLHFGAKLLPPSGIVHFHDSLVLLSGAVALVLLIACANVAHLLLARAAARERELAIRAALGAGRARLLRQLITESFVLSLAGCVGGILVGWLGLGVLVAARPDSLAELSASRLDATSLLVTIGLSVITGVVFGVVGASRVKATMMLDALKSGAQATSHSRAQQRVRSLLVVSEMALATTLLVGAALLVRSVVHLQTTDPGFDPVGLYSVQVRLTETRYSTPALRRAFFNELASRARAINGVEALTVADGAPPSRQFTIGALQVEGQPDPPAGTTSFVDVNGGEPDFFKVMGIRLVQGTTFTDTSAAAAQVVINEGFARKYWPGRSALGKRVRIVFNGKGDWRTIVGVAVNASTGGLGAEASAPMLYTPSNDHFQPVLVVRTAAAASPMADLRALVRGIDPLLPTPSVTSIADAMQKSIADPRFTMLLLTTFTTLALVLSAVGLYGVLAHAVAQRTREIGIRVALGATRRNIARAVVSQGVLLALGGIVCGMIGAKWATKLVDEMLYGVSRGDPLSFVIGGCVLLATAVVACIVPMRRAVSVDPLIAMRAE